MNHFGGSARFSFISGRKSFSSQQASKLALHWAGRKSFKDHRESSATSLSIRESVAGTWNVDEDEDVALTRSKKRLEPAMKLKRVESRHMQEIEKKGSVPWIRSTQADVVFALVIVASAIMTGIDVQVSIQPEGTSRDVEILLLVVNCFFLLFFVLELVLRVREAGLAYMSPFNPGGCLDATVILVGFTEVVLALFGVSAGAGKAAGAMRVVRLLRLLRMVRFVFVCKEMQMLMVGLMSSLSAVFWAMCLILLLMYFGSLFCVVLLVGGGVWEINAPGVVQYFGSVWRALFTHFQIVTLEAWPNICDVVMEATGQSLWAVYFMIIISIASLCLLNLVTGIVCEKLMSVGAMNVKDWALHDNEAYDKKVEQFRKKLSDIFDDAELNRYGKIDLGEFQGLMARNDMRELLRYFDITTSLNPTAVWDILDRAGDGALHFSEFQKGLLRLRGSESMVHSLMVQRDVTQAQVQQAENMRSCGEQIKTQITHSMDRLEEKLAPTLTSVDKRISEVQSALRERGSTLQMHEEHRAEEQKPYHDRRAARFDLPVEPFAFETHAASRLEALLVQLDEQCNAATQLLTSKSSTRRRHISVHASCNAGVSTAAQTDSSIDFIEGLAGAGSFSRARISI